MCVCVCVTQYIWFSYGNPEPPSLHITLPVCACVYVCVGGWVSIEKHLYLALHPPSPLEAESEEVRVTAAEA